uniref:Thioredoxin domain-containing protein n=1 Tax=Chelonoidis abingdonii TaxID=106734 RepID=A0A8C0HB93_CHEAB
MLGFKGLIVVDVYQGWCGPCRTVVNLFRKIKNELGDDLLHFAVAEVDSIDALENYRGKCEPTFLFYAQCAPWSFGRTKGQKAQRKCYLCSLLNKPNMTQPTGHVVVQISMFI